MGVAWVGPLYMVSGLGDTAASFPAGGGPGREVRNAPPGPATGRGWNEARGVGASPGRPCGIPGHGTVAERARRRAAAARTSAPHTRGRGVSVGNTAGGERVLERAPRRATLPPGRSSISPAAPRRTCRAPCCAVLFRPGPRCSLLSVSAVRTACPSSGGAAPAGRAGAAPTRHRPGRRLPCAPFPASVPRACDGGARPAYTSRADRVLPSRSPRLPSVRRPFAVAWQAVKTAVTARWGPLIFGRMTSVACAVPDADASGICRCRSGNARTPRGRCAAEEEQRTALRYAPLTRLSCATLVAP